MKSMLKVLVVMSTLMCSALFAADLKSAKAEGLVGEQTNGYLGLVVSSAPADIKALVASVNDQRKAHFAQIASKTGASLDEAAKVFAKEAFERTESGHFIQNEAGQWVKK